MSTERHILDAARDLYLEQGLQGLPMRKVADTVGISATAIYRHFDNRETLVLAICEEGFRRFGEYLYRGLRGETPLERLVLSGQGGPLDVDPGARRGLWDIFVILVIFLDLRDEFSARLLSSDNPGCSANERTLLKCLF